jgi:hypothetical protein
MANVAKLLSRVATRWRSEAKILHRRGADEQAVVLESCANEVEEEGRLFSLETLNLEQAVAESGYSYSALQKMVSDGTIQNVGKKGAPRVRRGDLPKKPRGRNESSKAEPDLADLVLAGMGSPGDFS